MAVITRTIQPSDEVIKKIFEVLELDPATVESLIIKLEAEQVPEVRVSTNQSLQSYLQRKEKANDSSSGEEV